MIRKKTILYFAFFIYVTKVFTQDLEPRFLSSAPLGTNFSGLVYGFSSGDILLNSQEVENLNTKLNTVAGFYGRSFKILNKPAKIDTSIPYSFGNLQAFIYEKDTSVYKNGLGDLSARLSMILVGEKALTKREFAIREPAKFKLGAALKIRAPIGTYDETKLINFGANRWSFQFKIASSYNISQKIILEAHIGSWFFTNNKNFNNGSTLKQEPLLSAQLHFAYIFNPKLWMSASIGQIAWGETIIDDVAQNNHQENSKYALTASYKIGKQSSLNTSLTNGLYTSRGANFSTFLVSYSLIWFDRK
ncbi:hypothetical protein KH5_08150 [Urechidicola sp. KH5]